MSTCRDSECDRRHCVVCDRRHLLDDEPATCVTCLGRARANLLGILTAYALLPDELLRRGGVSFEPIPTGGGSEPALPGGEALVLLAGGSVQGEGLPGDITPPYPLLRAWVRDWRARLGVRVGVHDLAGAVGFLDRNLAWAAQHHPEFAAFCDDVFATRSRLESVTRSGEALDRGGRIPCPECGEPLVRRFRDPKACPHVPAVATKRPLGPIGRAWRPVYRYEPRRRAQNSDQPSAAWRPCGCDQGGRTDSWVCPSPTCGRVVTDREYGFAVWAYLEAQREGAS